MSYTIRNHQVLAMASPAVPTVPRFGQQLRGDGTQVRILRKPLHTVRRFPTFSIVL